MKRLISISVSLLFFAAAGIFAQDMNNDAAKLYNEGNDKLKAGNYGGAIENYNAALDIEKDYRILYQKGVALKKQGKIDEARDSFEEAVKLKTDFEPGYNALGGTYFSSGDYQKAIDNFEKVLEISDNNNIKAKVKKNLALAYTKMAANSEANGNSEKAIEYLKHAVDNNNYDAAYLSLAKIYTETGQYDNAISAAENALKYKSSISSGGPYYYMGVAYKNKNDLDKAKEMFNQAKSDATYRKLVEYELSALH